MAERAFDQSLDQVSNLRSALIATAAFVVAFAAAAIPIPLYSHYQQTVGISDPEISLTIVSYLSGVLIVLFFAGSVSDALGRRPLVCAALGFGCVACLMFANLSGATMLQAARFVQGVSCGLTMSATSAFAIDSCGMRYRTLGVTVASCGSLIGLTFGSLGIGLFAETSSDYSFAFYGIAALCALMLALIPLTSETVTDRITLRKAIHPIVSVPQSLREVFPVAAGIYIATWGIGMFFQSLSTPAAAQYFGAAGVLVPALLLALAMAPSAIGGPIEARLSSHAAIRAGLVFFFLSCVGLTVTLAGGWLMPFLLFDVLFSVSQGVCLSAGMRMLIVRTETSESAGVVSLINFAGYVGSTLISLSMSWFATFVPLVGVFAFVTILGLFAVIPGLVHSFMQANDEKAARKIRRRLSRRMHRGAHGPATPDGAALGIAAPASSRSESSAPTRSDPAPVADEHAA